MYHCAPKISQKSKSNPKVPKVPSASFRLTETYGTRAHLLLNSLPRSRTTKNRATYIAVRQQVVRNRGAIVTYTQKRDPQTGENYGRLIARTENGIVPVQRMPNDIKACVVGGSVHDVDIKNSVFGSLLDIAQEARVGVGPTIREWATDRAGKIADLGETVDKLLGIKLLFKRRDDTGVNIYRRHCGDRPPAPEAERWASLFAREVDDVRGRLMMLKPRWEQRARSHGRVGVGVDGPTARGLALLLFDHETQKTVATIRALRKRGYTVESVIFDGCHVTKDTNDLPTDLRAIEAEVKRELGLNHFALAVKDFRAPPAITSTARETGPRLPIATYGPPPPPLVETTAKIQRAVDDEAGDDGIFETERRVKKLLSKYMPLVNERFCFVRGTDKSMIYERAAEFEFNGRIAGKRDCATSVAYEDCVLRFKVKADRPAKRSRTSDDGEAPAAFTTVTIPIIPHWRHWTGRLTFERVDFDATNLHDPGTLNLFLGLAIRPDSGIVDERYAGDVRRFCDHLRGVICHGEADESHEYLLNWCAHLIQRPGVKMASSVVVSGLYGVGKDIFLDLMAKIIGEAYTHTASTERDFIGHFNGWQMGCLLLVVKEAVWGGDKAAASALKDMVDGKTTNINIKHKPMMKIKQQINLAFSSNTTEAVPARIGSRRWFIVNAINERFRGSQETPEHEAYFRPWWDPKESHDFARSVAKFLYERDLSGFNPRNVPKTKATQGAIERLETSCTRWWAECLGRGWFLHDSVMWVELFTKDEIYASYQTFCDSEHIKGRRESIRQLFKRIKDMRGLDPREMRVKIHGNRIRKICFDDLHIERRRFREHIGIPWSWE